MNHQELEEYWDYLEEVVGLSEKTLQLVTSILGFTEETLNSLLYAETGYRSWSQFRECEGGDDDE